MNRCMYSSNYQNQMANSCGRPMQRPDACRPQQSSNACGPVQSPYHSCQNRRSDTCHTAPHSGQCHQNHHPDNCHPVHHSGSCHTDPCMESRRPMPNTDCCKPAQKPESCTGKPDCGNHENSMEKPKYTRAQMLQYINEVSFAVNDILLYLDTHPCDSEAMKFYRKNVARRDAALCEFAKHYGPLTVDTADESRKDTWEWVMQPWPWVNGS